MDIDWDMERRAAAYHEAGHAVFALNEGWEISPEGVEIDRRWHTGLRIPILDLSAEAPAVRVWLAGWRAEHKWHGRGAGHSSPDGIEWYIAEIRDEFEEEMAVGGDDADAIRHLLKLHPAATDDEIHALYRRYEAETLALLDELWPKIERVAAELIKLGELSALDVHRLAGHPDPKWCSGPRPPGASRVPVQNAAVGDGEHLGLAAGVADQVT
jgi:hypothetical protein